MSRKKWITYGITGVVGLGIVAGGAAAVASSMDLRTSDGTVLPGGSITDRSGVLDRETVTLRDSGSSVSVVSTASAPSALSVDSAPTVVSVPSVHSPASAPSAHSPASAPSADSVDSPASVASAGSD